MKVLITADIHLGDYQDFNYSAGARTHQFDILSNRLIELGDVNQCEELWILGDFLRVPNNKARVQHLLSDFLIPLINHFKKVRYILGQHDIDGKTNHPKQVDTIVSLFDCDNFVYSDCVVLSIDNHTFAFHNWTPDQDLSWLSEQGYDKVDVLLGHYTKSTLFGQDIDETKFDLMIHGDIHNDQVIDKFVSVGNPIQHDYSSQPNGTCVVLDTATLAWKHIQVDESKTRFLRLYYTGDPDKEGFNGPLEYYKYLPPIQKQLAENGRPSIEWSEVDDLLTKLTKDAGLEKIHDEIVTLASSDSSEIDFNVRLVSLDIEGYRSIVKFHLDFVDNDRIILVGDNGSGKSSIIGALKAVFTNSRYIGYEKSDLCDRMLITIKFIYQNKLVEITKGDSWKLVIDGDQVNYNNKTDFENDLVVKYPFINYLDLFFIAAGSSSLSNQMNSERRIQLLKKFYRLDKLDIFYSKATDRYNEERAKTDEIKSKLNQEQGALIHVKSRLEELETVDLSLEDQLTTELNHFQQLRDQNLLFKEWKLKYEQLLRERDRLQELIDKYKLRLVVDVDNARSKIEQNKSKVKLLNDEIIATTQRVEKIKQLESKLADTESRGVDLKNKLNELIKGVCPECGSKLSEGKHKELADNYGTQIAAVREEWVRISNELESFPEEERNNQYITTKLIKLRGAVDDLTQESTLLANKISMHELAKSDIASTQQSLDKAVADITAHESIKPEEVQIPQNITSEEDRLRSELAKIGEKTRELASKDDIEKRIALIEVQLSDATSVMNTYNEYSKLMHTNGPAMEEILKKLAERFSSTSIKYEVNAGVSRNKRYINFDAFYFVRKKWRIYNSLSSGQKQLCDIDFLNNLFSLRVGFLILDEYFRHLDEKNFADCIDKLKMMNVNTILFSTHDPNFAIYTKRIILKLNDRGETEYNIL